MYTAKILPFKKGLISSDVPYQILRDGVVVEEATLYNLNPATSALKFIARRIKTIQEHDKFDETTLIGDINLDELIID